MQVMHHKAHGDFKMPAWPVRVNGKPSRIASSPMLGEHTTTCCEMAGNTEAEVATLRVTGVLMPVRP